jgi:EmrB/QacA subfamily drug resistance transporter
MTHGHGRSGPGQPGPSRTARRWWILAGSSIGLFMLMLDSTAIALALPTIRLDLGASGSGIQWAQNIYLLALAALVTTLGRIGDLVGRRLIFCAGLIVFSLGSIVSALAGSIAVLVAGRAIQGVGAAAMLALSLAVATLAFPPEERGRAIGIWAAVSSVALAVGPLVGGVVVEFASWRWLFLLNLPLAALCLTVLLASMPESRDESAGRRIDVAGVVVLSAGLTLVVLALVQGKSWGWTSLGTLGALVIGVALLALFTIVEKRASEPIIDLSLFRSGPYLGASAAAFALVGSYWTVMFLLPQYLDLALRFSTARAGVLMLPVTVPMAFMSPVVARLVARVSARLVMTVGMACATAGMLVLTRLDGSSDYYDVAPGLLLFGLALGLVYAPMSAAAMAALPAEKAGVASGALAMVRCLAGAMLLAGAGAVFQHVQVEERQAGESFEGAFAAGIADTAWLLSAVLLAGTVLTWMLVRSATGARHAHHRRFHF